jgi:hypothetical protein
MSEQDNNTGLKIALGILAILLIGASSLFFLKNNELNDTKIALNGEISVLDEKLQDKISELNIKISENEVLNEDLLAKRDSLNITLNELRASKASVATLTKYKSRYFQLKKDIKKLYADNERLQLANSELSKANDSIVGQLDNQLKLSESLNAQVSDANKIIQSASELSVAALNGTALIIKSSGRQVITNKARRTDKVKVCFSVAENRIAKSGDKTLYVQVLDSKNNVLGENALIVLNDKTLNYSFKTSFNYNNKVLDICELLEEPKSGFGKGNYFINVYRSSELIANSSFKLD